MEKVSLGALTLRQFGIASAADVRADLIERVPGFGPTLTASLLAWRRSCVASFRFDPTDPVTARKRSQTVQPSEQHHPWLPAVPPLAALWFSANERTLHRGGAR